jgi:uncharacterized membrane protein
MDIVLTTNGTHTLVDIINANPTHANFVSQTAFSQGMATTIIVQAKVVSYCDQHFKDDFILLTIEIIRCLPQ